MNWNEWTETNEITWRNWREGMQIFWSTILDEDAVDRWHEALAEVARTLCRPHCRPHLQKVVRPRQFFWATTWWRCGGQMTWRSCYSSAHTLSISLPTSSSKSGPNLSFFLRCLSEIEPSLQSRAHFVDLLFKKWSKHAPSVFYNYFIVINYYRMKMWSTDDMKLSLQSRAHTLSTSLWTSSSKSGPTPSVFDDSGCDQLYLMTM